MEHQTPREVIPNVCITFEDDEEIGVLRLVGTIPATEHQAREIAEILEVALVVHEPHPWDRA